LVVLVLVLVLVLALLLSLSLFAIVASVAKLDEQYPILLLAINAQWREIRGGSGW